jgi:hypothetical protein
MTRKEQNKITRETHERVDFGQWHEELAEDDY